LALGTLIPDSGHVIRGERVGAMLALQAGLHPDFTGLENVLMKSAFHGISRKEAMALLPSIEEFSELGAAFYQPIRTYSSGMSARLAFSTLIAMRWDLLLIDEVLAVGDLQFQQKCLSAIDSYLDGGGTVVLVSHNPKTILSICATSMWVKKGRVGKVGPSREVVDLYREALLASELTALSPRVAK
jgi:lipopolysaccharide transport system ATP-binding protein